MEDRPGNVPRGPGVEWRNICTDGNKEGGGGKRGIEKPETPPKKPD